MKRKEIEEAAPGDTLKDDLVPGLMLRCFPKGKKWYVYYRAKPNGKQRKPKIGDYPGMGLDLARSVARKMLAEAALGGDPSRDRRTARKAENIAGLCDRYISDYAETNKRPRSVQEDQRYIDNVIKPRWGKLNPEDLTSFELFSYRNKCKATPVKFNRCMALLSKMLNFARVQNVTKEVPRYPEKKRQRFLSPDELKALGAALAKYEVAHPNAVAAIRLILLTGARMSEIIRCRREWRHGDQLRLPSHKTSAGSGMKVIHLPEEAVAILDSLNVTGDFLCGIESRPTKVWNKIVEETGAPHFTIHDLRRTYISEGLDAGFSLDQLGKIVGHRTTATTNGYAYLQETKRRTGSQNIGTVIAGSLSDKST